MLGGGGERNKGKARMANERRGKFQVIQSSEGSAGAPKLAKIGTKER